MSNITQLTGARRPTPHTQNGKVPPRRVKNAVLRSQLSQAGHCLSYISNISSPFIFLFVKSG